MKTISVLFLSIWINIGHIVELNRDIPQFWLLPEPEIYEDEAVREVIIQIVVSPVNTSIMLAYMSIGSGGYSDEMKLLNFGSSASFLSSDDVGVIIESKETVGPSKSQEKWKLKIVRCSLIFEKSLHFLAKNSLGTVTSRPFRIIRKVLNPFPLVHHESAEFLMGNVGQIVCMIPHSKPSPPNIEFLHDNVAINTTKGTKYKKIYLHPGAMILLIKNLMPQDAGSYTCTASFQDTKSFQKSDKKTRLTVSVPKEKIKPRFRLSSHDNERKGDKVIEVVEGSNITLYCLFESAPVAEVTWYWSNSNLVNRKYETDSQFGTLLITNVQLEDSSKFSCLTSEGHARSFDMKVISLPRFTSTPFEIPFQKFENKLIEITCEVQNNVLNSNIKWFHDGKILTEKEDKLKFLKNSLIINALEKKHLGIYQCWLENDGSLWATGVTIIRTIKELEETDSQRENTSIIDKRTSPGLTIHLECSLQQSQKDSITDFSVKWLRYKDSLEPIDLHKNKYVMFNMKSERKNILSIVNPTKNQDEGIYICKLYDQQSRLLHTIKYLLTIDDQKSNEPNQFQLKSTEITSKKELVSPPEVVKINDYSYGVNIKWKVLPDEKTSNFIDHFRVEYQKNIIDKTQQKDASLAEEEVFMIDDYPTINQITVTDQSILGPNIAIRFRVMIILKVFSQIPSSENVNKTIFGPLKSGWSNVIDFRNLLNCKLKISNKAVAPTAIEVMWTHNCVRDIHWQQISFHILYISIVDCIKLKRCQQDKHSKNYESILIFPEFKDLQYAITTDRNFGEFFQENITGLKSDNEYVIALYGKQVTTSQDVFYIPLSNIIKVATAKLTKPDYQEPVNQQNSISESDDARNRVIFLILGSLAGVLFVVAAVMFGMCTWYYMKKHMKIHKVHMKPSDISQPTFLFHYPPSSMSSPLCYGSRINPLSPYQQSLSPTNNLIYYPNQTVGKSPLNTTASNQNDMWPLNYYSHSPNTMAIPDKFSSDRDSDMDSTCNSEKNMNNNTRRPIVMGVDQASSTYSRIGSERRFSIGALNMMPNDYPNNFQNMTLPRQNIVPIVFPQPPCDPQPGKYSIQYQNTLCSNDLQNQNIDHIDENSASVPFLDKRSSWRNSSMNSLMKKDYMEASNTEMSVDNLWAADTYYDPYSSNSSVANETTQLNSMIHAYP